MNIKIRILILAALLSLGTGCGPANSGLDMQGKASMLRTIYSYWVNHGRPNNFNITEAIYPVGPDPSYFVFTNQVSIKGKTYHCQFGSRYSHWPGGVLAITDEKVTLWIPDRADAKVTVSPESCLRVER